jgi:hypothetical protein
MSLTKVSYSMIEGAFANVLDFGAVNDGTGNQAPAIQAAIDSLAATGGVVFLPTGTYRTTSSLNMKTGVSLQGTGYSYEYIATDILKGSWIKYEGVSGSAALFFTDCANITVSDIGIFCGPIVAGNRIGIFMTSDNNPSVKHLTFERIAIVAASICVKWGNQLPLEQVDAITFRDFYFDSFNFGFAVNGANAGDYSLIERGTLFNVIVAGFDLRLPKLLRISDCAQGGTAPTTVMFNITGGTGSSAPIHIMNCQSEAGGGYFLYATGPNDLMQIILEHNIINQRVYCDGILRCTSRNNYINGRVDLRNGVFWRSEDDRIFKSTTQAITWDVVNSNFYATTMSAADNWFGYRLPKGFQIFSLDFSIGQSLARINTREGVYCNNWFAATVYPLGDVVVPTVDNGFYYKVTVAGTSGGSQPVWPTTIGLTVTDGGVTWQCTGGAALIGFTGAIT